MRWLAYWALCLATTVGAVLSVIETQGHTLGGAILAGVGAVAVFGLAALLGKVIWEFNIYR